MQSNKKEDFVYSYSAKEQEEIRRIRDKYEQRAKDEEDKMQRLRRLDEGVTRMAQAVSLTLGIIGVLVMGFGMSLCMSELGMMLGASEWLSVLLGIIIGVAGIALISLAYPTYNFVVKRRRKRIAPEIIRLTDELMK